MTEGYVSQVSVCPGGREGDGTPASSLRPFPSVWSRPFHGDTRTSGPIWGYSSQRVPLARNGAPVPSPGKDRLTLRLFAAMRFPTGELNTTSVTIDTLSLSEVCRKVNQLSSYLNTVLQCI